MHTLKTNQSHTRLQTLGHNHYTRLINNAIRAHSLTKDDDMRTYWKKVMKELPKRQEKYEVFMTITKH